MKATIRVLAALSALAVTAAESMYPVLPAKGAIVLDGKPDEPAWRSAPTGTCFFPLGADRSGPPTEFKALRSPDGIYLALFAEEKETDALTAKNVDRQPIWAGDDSFEGFLSASNAVAPVHFAANAAGKQYCPEIKTAATIVPGKGYRVEMFVPFSTLGADAATKRLSGNICRNRFVNGKPEYYSWCRVKESYREPDRWAEFYLLSETTPTETLNKFIDFRGDAATLQNARELKDRLAESLQLAAAAGATDKRIVEKWKNKVAEATRYLDYAKAIETATRTAPENPFAAVVVPAEPCPDPRSFLSAIELAPEEKEFLVKIKLEALLK